MGIGRTFMGEVSSAPLSLRVENPAEGGGVHMDDEAIFWDLCSECGSEASAVSAPFLGKKVEPFMMRTEFSCELPGTLSVGIKNYEK